MKALAMELDQRLEKILQADVGQIPEHMNLQECLETLEQHECWEAYTSLVYSQRTYDGWISLARIQSLQQQNIQATIHSLKQLIQDHHVSASEIISDILGKITPPHNPTRQFDLLNGIWDSFAEHQDKIICCEAIANILEKQLRHSHSLEDVHKLLLKLDPHNIKALLFFKTLFRQEEKWENMAEICKTLLSTKRHPAEHGRVAQEYAAILLYQLDAPQACLQVLEEHCSNTKIDQTTLKFDAWKHLKQWDLCLQLLHQTLATTHNQKAIAVLYFRQAQIQELAQQQQHAFECYQKAIQNYPHFLEAAEQWIRLCFEQQNKEELIKVIDFLEKSAENNSEMLHRIQTIKAVL